MNNYVKHYHELKKEVKVSFPEDSIFIGLAKSVAKYGSIEDLQALVKEHDEDMRKTLQ